MKVLLINPEKPLSFWSFHETCRILDRKSLIPSLGLATVAALLPSEWKLHMVDLNCRQLSSEDWNWADMVMVSGMTVQSESLLHIVREAKRRGKIVLAGGPWPTTMPEKVLDAGADFLVLGEAEANFPLFLSALEAGDTHGVFEPREFPDITSSPIPRFDLVTFEDYASLSIQTSRGCPFDCEFCDVVALYGHKPRYKTPDQVISELEYLYELGWRNDVFIADDNFIGNKKHAKAILEKLIPWKEEHHSPFIFGTQVSVNIGQDREMVDLMTMAGFVNVFIGLESPDQDILELNRKYQNIKNPIVESLTNLRDNGLTVIGSFVLGFDGEKKEVGKRIYKLVESTNLPFVVINTLHALPRTSLWKRLDREGRLLPEKTSGDTTGQRLNYVPTRPEKEIMDEYAELWNLLYDPPRYLDRTLRYFLAMRPTRPAIIKAKGQPIPDNLKSAPPTLREKWWNFRKFLKLSWRQGVLAPYKIQYWKQAIILARKNPSRLQKYFLALLIGESMFQLRKTIEERTSAVKGDIGPIYSKEKRSLYVS